MKKKYIRELVPYAATGILLVASITVSNNAQACNVSFEKSSDNIFPDYSIENNDIEMKPLSSMDMLVIELMEETNAKNVIEYIILKPSDVNNIVYTDDNQSLLITTKESEICYLGTYNDIKKRYLYKQINKEDISEIQVGKQLIKS